MYKNCAFGVRIVGEVALNSVSMGSFNWISISYNRCACMFVISNIIIAVECWIFTENIVLKLIVKGVVFWLWLTDQAEHGSYCL